MIGEAGNGTDAITRFTELRPELTILDITMPEKDGLEALARSWRSTPTLACSCAPRWDRRRR